MIKVENISVYNFENAFKGMRNPLESWDQSDSYWVTGNMDGEDDYYPDFPIKYIIGEKDLELALKLIKAGSDHSKFMRQIFISMDITAPDYWWKEFSTYKVGTVENSTSTMHSILKKPITLEMFSVDDKEKWEKNKVDQKEIINDSLEEEWVDITDYEGCYQISTKGQIKSCNRYVGHNYGGLRLIKSRILTQSINSSGYKKVRLSKDGIGANFYVHRLIAEHFIDNPQNKPEVNHKDGNKLNNNISNLEWVTEQENTQHAHDNGLAEISGYNKFKVSQKARKLTDEQVKEIREKYQNGISIKELTQEYNIKHNSIICNIVHNKLYNEIKLSHKDIWKLTIEHLENLRQEYIKTKDQKIWRMLIQDLPMSFNYLRTWTGNYQCLRNMYHARKNHKLEEWREFCKRIESLPYSELITCERRN